MFQEYLSISNKLDPDQAQHYVEPDLGQNKMRIKHHIASLLLFQSFSNDIRWPLHE